MFDDDKNEDDKAGGVWTSLSESSAGDGEEASRPRDAGRDDVVAVAMARGDTTAAVGGDIADNNMGGTHRIGRIELHKNKHLIPDSLVGVLAFFLSDSKLIDTRDASRGEQQES